MVLITEMLEICIQTSYDQNIQLILKSYLPVVLGTTLNVIFYQNMPNLHNRYKSAERKISQKYPE